MQTRKDRLAQLQGEWTAAEISVSYKLGTKTDIPITGTGDVYPVILSFWNMEFINIQEQMMAFYLNGRGKVMGYRLLCTGSMTECTIDVRLLVSLALHTLATSVILAHNHPSGSLRASVNDIKTTAQIKKALKLINVKLWDHLIISETGWLSMFKEGLM